MKYSIGIVMMESTDYFIPLFIIQPKESGAHAQESLCHTAGMVLNVLQVNSILYNVMMAEGGNTLYIIPRKEDAVERFGSGIFDLAGAFKCSLKEDVLKCSYKDYQEYVRKNIALAKTEFQTLKQLIIKAIEAEYKGKKH